MDTHRRILLAFICLWVLSHFEFPDLQVAFTVSTTLARTGGVSVVDVILAFTGFIGSWYLARRVGHVSKSLYLIVEDTGTQEEASLESFLSAPFEKFPVTWIDVFRALVPALAVRECLPSMMPSDPGQSWLCNVAGIVAFLFTLLPALILHAQPNTVRSVRLQELNVSVAGDRTIVQTPSLTLQKKKKQWFILVDKSPQTPTRDVGRQRALQGPPPSPDSPLTSNDTFSISDALAGFEGDNLKDEELPPQLAEGGPRNERQPLGVRHALPLGDLLAAGSSSKERKVMDVLDMDDELAKAELRVAIPTASSTPGPSRKRRRRRRESINAGETIYTSKGALPISKLPYQLFSPASMKASELASALLSDDGRIKCHDWRIDVEDGRKLLEVDEMIEQHNKDFGELEEGRAKLKALMRELGANVPTTPPRAPEVKITPASPQSTEKLELPQPEIVLMANGMPRFVDKRVPLVLEIPQIPVASSSSKDEPDDPEFPSLKCKEAKKYPKLIEPGWPADFPTDPDTSDEWKLTQEMIDFWRAREAKKKVNNPPPPEDIDKASIKSDDGNESDRSLADFDSTDGDIRSPFDYDDEPCVPGNSRLKCVGWRYEIVAPEPKVPKEPRVTLVDMLKDALLKNLQAIQEMHVTPELETQVPEPTEVDSPPPAPRQRSRRPPSPIPLEKASLIVEPGDSGWDRLEDFPSFDTYDGADVDEEPSRAPSEIAPCQPPPAPAPVVTSTKAPSRSTNKVAPSPGRTLRPRPSVPVAPGPNKKSTLRPRNSIATTTVSVAIQKKPAPRPSLPPTHVTKPAQAPITTTTASAALSKKLSPRVSLAPTRPVVPKPVARRSLPPPKPPPAIKNSQPPAKPCRQSLLPPKAAPTASAPPPQPKTVLKKPALPAKVGSTSRPSLPIAKPSVKPTVVVPMRKPLASVTNVPRPPTSAPSAPPPKVPAPTRPRSTSRLLAPPALEKLSEAVEPFDIGDGEMGYFLKIATEDPSKVLYKIDIGPLEIHIDANLKTLVLGVRNILNIAFVSPVVLAEGPVDLKNGSTWNIGYPGLISGVASIKLEGKDFAFMYKFVVYGIRYDGKKTIAL
ncbi:hypothetical protein H0H92_005430 [Tricholoma furcatifolium]|nr:hypothetical protein H0H92_005430 [Tricholoma furcatifolium]